jgi:hypothetical protein
VGRDLTPESKEDIPVKFVSIDWYEAARDLSRSGLAGRLEGALSGDGRPTADNLAELRRLMGDGPGMVAESPDEFDIFAVGDAEPGNRAGRRCP